MAMMTNRDARKMFELSDRLDYLTAARWVAARSASGNTYVAAPGTLAQHVRPADVETAEAIARTPSQFDQLMSVRDIDEEISRLQAELLLLVKS